MFSRWDDQNVFSHQEAKKQHHNKQEECFAPFHKMNKESNEFECASPLALKTSKTSIFIAIL